MRDELPRLPSEAYIKGREDASKKLRDEFAGLAMQAIVSNDHAMNHINRVYKGIPVVRGVSMLSYEYADAMMEARYDR